MPHILLLITLLLATPAFSQEDGAVRDVSQDALTTLPGTTDATGQPIENNPNTDPRNFTNKVVLQGLNKITARTSRLETSLDKTIKFGNLDIILRKCWKSPPEEEPESKALIEIWEEIPGEIRRKVFTGWIFSSSPAISAPEHPVYDITLLECVG